MKRVIRMMACIAIIVSVLGCTQGEKGSAPTTSAATGERPNIVLIMADDMGYSDIGCYGGEISTPTLDALAGDGLRFTQFYNTARCCPTRASLMTGLYPHQAGIGHMMYSVGLPGYEGDLSANSVTIAEVLKTAGYNTLMSGKWHVTKQVGYWTQEEDLQSKHNWPRQRGFDEFFGTIHGAGSFWDPITLTRDNTPIRAEGDEFHYTDAIADNGVNFIEEYAAQDAPFFLYLPFTSPHWPLHAFEEDIARYENTYDIGYDKLRDNRRQRMIEMGIINADWPLTPRDDRVEPWEDRPNKEWEARRMAVYAAQITQMDRAIGRVVDKLKELQILDNTLIMFLADNGGCAEILRDNGNPRAIHTPYRTRDGRTVRFGNDPDIMPGPTDTYQSYGPPWANASNTPFRLYKHWVHEGGIATPLIVHWPAQLKGAGSLNEGPGHLIDIMATCIDAAGAEYPATYKGNAITPLEGKSLLPVVTTGERQGHDAIYWEHEGNRAVRQGDWKLVARNRNEWELYNINEDRTEMNNLASQQPDKVRELTALYEAYAARSQVVDYDTMRKRAQGQTY